MNDNVEHPKHYTSHPSGIEWIHYREVISRISVNAAAKKKKVIINKQ